LYIFSFFKRGDVYQFHQQDTTVLIDSPTHNPISTHTHTHTHTQRNIDDLASLLTYML